MEDDANTMELNVDTIINCFYSVDFDTSLSEDGVELLRLLDKASVDKLFVQNVEDEAKSFQYLCSILRASIYSSLPSSKRRLKCILEIIQYLKLGKLNNRERRIISEKIINIIQYIEPETARVVADTIVNKISPSSEDELNGYSTILEFFPSIVAVGGLYCRENTIETLCSVTWPTCMVVMLSAALVEICHTEVDCKLTVNKISTYFQLDLSCDVQPSGIFYGGCGHIVDPEELPALAYQLITLSKKGDEKESQKLKFSILSALANLLDTISFTVYHSMRVVENRHEEQSQQAGWHANIAFANEGELSAISPQKRIYIEGIIATIVHHVSMLVTKDQGICTEIVRLIKGRRLLQSGVVLQDLPLWLRNQFSDDSDSDENTILPSASRLLFAMLAQKSPRLSAIVLNHFCEMIDEIIRLNQNAQNSLWCTDQYWRCATHCTPEFLLKTFELLIHGILMTESIAAPLVDLGFLFILKSKSTVHTAKLPLSTPTISMLPAEKNCYTAADFGMWLIKTIFIKNVYSRSFIIKEIVLRLQLMQTTGTANRMTTCQSTVESALILILEALTQECKYGMIECSSDLQEGFVTLPFLHPTTAGELIHVIGPLFCQGNALSDRCALALRKASFCKDIPNRHAAVSALTAFLNNQLSHISDGHHKRPMNHSQTDQLSRRVVISGLSVDEILSLCRRFLQHQAPIRSHLYQEFIVVANDFPQFRNICMRLLHSHFQNILLDCDGIGVNNGPMSAIAGDSIFKLGNKNAYLLNIERCIDLGGNQQEAIGDFILSLSFLTKISIEFSEANPIIVHPSLSQSSSSQQELLIDGSGNIHYDQAAVDILVFIWRLANGLASCELVDLGFSSHISTLGEYKKLVILIECIQALLSAIACSPLRFGNYTVKKSNQTSFIQSLGSKLEAYTDIIIIFRKKWKDNQKSEANTRKISHAGNENLNMQHDVTSNDISKGIHLQYLPQPHLVGELYGGLKSPVMAGYSHLLCHEMIFISKLLDKMNHFDNETENFSEEDDLSNQILIKSDCYESLHKHILERALHTLECSVEFMTLVDGFTSQSNFARTNDNLNLKQTEYRTLTETAIQIGYRISSSISDLFTSLLRDMISQRSEDNSDQHKSNTNSTFHWSRFSQLSSKQLVFRGLLGCIKVAKLKLSVLKIHTRAAEELAAIMEISMQKALPTPTSRSASMTNPTSSSAQTIEYHVKKFVNLMIKMHENPSEQLECPIVVAIICELLDTIATDISMKHVSNNLLKNCNEKLNSVNSQLSHALIQMLTLRMPQSPDDRFVQLQGVVQAILKTAHSIELAANDDFIPLAAHSSNERADSIAINTNIICRKSMTGTVQTVISIFDKMMIDMDALLKLAQKSTLSLVSNKSRQMDSDHDGSSMNSFITQSTSQVYNIVSLHLKNGMSIVKDLLILPSVDAISFTVLSSFLKMFKMQIKLVKNAASNITKFNFSASNALSKNFVELCSVSSSIIAPAIQEYISQVHNSHNTTNPDQKSSGSSSKGSRLKVGRLIPELIYQMEQLDVCVIKLQGQVAGRDRHIVGKWIRKTTARDFRLKVNLIDEHMEQAKEAEAERSMKKRKLVEKKQGKSQNSKQKKCSNDSDEDTYGMLVDEGCEVEEENCDD